MTLRSSKNGYGNPYAREDPVVCTGRAEAQTFTIDTPMGPHEVTYSHFGDEFETKYRGERIRYSDLSRVLKEIEVIEAKAREVKAINKRRKSIAQNPEDATLASTLEEIKVRGIDLRTADPKQLDRARWGDRGPDLLITRADGTKENVSANKVLRPLEQSDLLELKALRRAVERAQKAVPVAKTLQQIAKDNGYEEIDLIPAYDPATNERVTSFEGKEFRGETIDSLEQQVWLHICSPTHPWSRESRYSSHDAGAAPCPMSQVEKPGPRIEGFLTYEEALAVADAELEVEAAEKIAEEALRPLAFDVSLVLPEPIPEPEQVDEEPVHLDSSLHAPEQQDWEDDLNTPEPLNCR